MNRSRVYEKDLDTSIAHIVKKEELYKASFLITGCTGTIGSFLTGVLLRLNEEENAGIKIYAGTRDEKRVQQLLGKRDDLITFHYDISEEIILKDDVDYIVHLAGNAHPAAFNTFPTETIVGAVDSTYRLLEYGRTHGVKRVLFLSSGEVYSDIDNLTARAAYPVSKQAGETLCVAYSEQYDLDTVIARSCHTFGPIITKTDNRAHAQFIRRAVVGDDIILKSTGKQLRSYLYVADCVSAILSVLSSGNSRQAYDIAAADNVCTIAELAGMIADINGCKVQYEEADGIDKRDLSPIPNQVLSGEKLLELGWTPAFTICEGVVHTLDILKEGI